MASNFTSALPNVDVIPDAGPTLATPQHDALHNDTRDAVHAIQVWIRTYVLPIFANGWVTNARILNGAVTDSKIASVTAAKVLGTITNPVGSQGNVTAVGDVQAGGFMRAGSQPFNPPFRIQEYAGTLNSVGELVVSHNITNAHLRVMCWGAWYKGPNGEMRPLDIISINSSGFHLRKDTHIPDNPPAGGAKFKAYLMYRETTLAW